MKYLPRHGLSLRFRHFQCPSVIGLGSQAAQAHCRNADVTLASLMCYKRLFTKACVERKRFILEKKRNVVFLNKIDLPYCLVVFFNFLFARVSGRFEAFSVTVSAILVFHCQEKDKEEQWRSIRRSRRIILLGNYPGLNSSRNSEQRCSSSMSIQSIRNSSHRSFTSDAFVSCSNGFRISN